MDSKVAVLTRRPKVKSLNAHLQFRLWITGHAHSVEAR